MYLHLSHLISFKEIASNLVSGIASGVEFDSIAKCFNITLAQTWNRACLNVISNIFRNKPDTEKCGCGIGFCIIDNPHTKFEAISSKDLGGDRFRATIHVLRQSSYVRPSNF